MNFNESETKRNLEKALQGEALAHMRYMIYASLIGKTSKKMQNDIEETAHNEKEHWKVFAKILYGEDYYNDIKNLETAILGESEECKNLYRDFANTAQAEGFQDIADKFNMIADIECKHAELFKINKNTLEIIDKEELMYYKCKNCGYIHKGDKPPEVCPVCDHPKEYFL